MSIIPLNSNNNYNMYNNITFKDIYFTPNYGKVCEHSDNATWECCMYKDLLYVYLKKPYLFEHTLYYDLITPYGYSGYYYENKNTLDEFIPMFREESKKRNYLTEVVRQNPYINMNIEIDMQDKYLIITQKKTFGVLLNNFSNFDSYIENTHKDNKRGYKIALKHNLVFKIEEYNTENLIQFKEIYNSTMNKLNSSSYYYFNDKYYSEFLNQKEHIFFANVYKDELLIASCTIMQYGNYLHYHLGGSLIKYRNLRPNNFLHCKVIEYGIQNKYTLYHLGGGLNNHDNLHVFKSKIANIQYNYNIYKNILNKEVYDKIVKVSPENDGFFPIHR